MGPREANKLKGLNVLGDDSIHSPLLFREQSSTCCYGVQWMCANNSTIPGSSVYTGYCTSPIPYDATDGDTT